MRIAIVVGCCKYIELNSPCECTPTIVVDGIEIREPVCSAVVESRTEAHVACKSVSHDSKVFSVDKLIGAEGIGTDIGITESDVICLGPLDSSFVRRTRYIVESGCSVNLRASCSLPEHLNSLASCSKSLTVGMSVVCIDVALINNCRVTACSDDILTVIYNEAVCKIFEVIFTSAVLDRVGMYASELCLIVVTTICICLYKVRVIADIYSRKISHTECIEIIELRVTGKIK